jgi:hypothetical protein
MIFCHMLWCSFGDWNSFIVFFLSEDLFFSNRNRDLCLGFYMTNGVVIMKKRWNHQKWICQRGHDSCVNPYFWYIIGNDVTNKLKVGVVGSNICYFWGCYSWDGANPPGSGKNIPFWTLFGCDLS